MCKISFVLISIDLNEIDMLINTKISCLTPNFYIVRNGISEDEEKQIRE